MSENKVALALHLYDWNCIFEAQYVCSTDSYTVAQLDPVFHWQVSKISGSSSRFFLFHLPLGGDTLELIEELQTAG